MFRRENVFTIIIDAFAVLALLSASEGFVLLRGGWLRANGIGDFGISCASCSSRYPSRSSRRWLLAATAEGSDPALPLVKIEEPPVISVPVFSLATLNEDASTNMNIVTYASPVGIEPERMWMLSLFQGTLSYDNFFREGWGVLQLLRQKHAPLVPLLGKISGRDIEKKLRSAQELFHWEEPRRELLSAPQTIDIISDCEAYVTLRMCSRQPAGDHDVVVCRVEGVAECDREHRAAGTPESERLETQYLRQSGII